LRVVEALKEDIVAKPKSEILAITFLEPLW
jgi:hypothetical protein